MASTLETFLFLFETDASKASDDVKKLNDTLNQTEPAGKKAGSAIDGVIGSAKGMLGALFGVAAFVGGIKTAATYADRLDELSQALDVNIEELSAWGDAVKKNGGTAEGFQETVKGMTASLADFATKGTSRAAPFFEQLGIKMVDAKGKARGFIDLLPELADKFQTLSKAESFGIGTKLGLDQGTIMLLQKGRREIDAVIARQKELGVVTKREGEIAAKFNDQIDDMMHSFRSLFTTVNSFALPAITRVLRAFELLATFFRNHPALIQGAIVGFSGLLAVMFPLATAIGVVGAALYLLIDDYDNFKKGNDSLMGEWPLLAQFIHAATEALKLLDVLVRSFFMLASLGIRKLGEGISMAFEGFMLIASSAKNAVLELWEAITSVFSYLSNVPAKIAGAFNNIKSALGFGDSDIDVNVVKAQQALNLADSSPIMAQTSSSISNITKAGANQSRTTSVQTGDIIIQTQATDSEGISSSIRESFKNQISQLLNDSDDGVIA